MLDSFSTRVLPEKPADAHDHLATQIVEDMHLRWLKGDCPPVEEYLERHPELRDGSDALLRIIYEEYCIRQERGEEVRPAEYMNRFPKWQHRLKPLLECHRLLAPEPPTSEELSRIAECRGEFRIVGELGKGSESQVFLGLQATLADRPVVLKVAPAEGYEHLTLARLQHTHIVPLYGLHEDRPTHYRVLCMPYLGGVTLEQLLDHLRPIPLSKRTGADVLRALDKMQAGSAVRLPTQGPARALLARLDFAQAVCWMGACLAEALAFAHQRDLVHLDVKPSNILITADAQPMLLDFHIAQKPVASDDPSPAWIGGTPRFASPEQLAAMSAMAMGNPLKESVSSASDIYSLGLVLYKALGGELPIPDGKLPPRLERQNPQVSVGLADILERCLRPRSGDRYRNGTALAEDLRRHLTDQPLQGVANRSVKERWKKWRRRRPYALHLAMMLIALLGAGLAFGSVALTNIAHDRRQAEAALQRGEEHQRQGNHALAQEEFQRGLGLAESTPGTGAIQERLRVRLNESQRLYEVEQLHQLANRLRYLAGSNQRGNVVPASLDERWRKLWRRRDEFLEAAPSDLSIVEREKIRNDLYDLGLLWAEMSLRGKEGAGDGSRQTWDVLREVHDTLGESTMLWLLTQEVAERTGKTHDAEEAGRKATAFAPRTPWEQAALGRTYLARGNLKEARAALDRAVELKPDSFWANFHLGSCAYRQEDHEEAAAAFRVCLALSPGNTICLFNRGLALAALGRREDAIQAFTRAIEMDPQMGDAYLQRGILHRQAKHNPPAMADLRRARELNADSGEVFYQMAQLQRDMGEIEAARDYLRQALAVQPGHEGAVELRRAMESDER